MKNFKYICGYYISKFLKKLRLSAVTNSTIDTKSKIESGTNFAHSSMAKHSFCGYDCEIYYCDIGSFTSIANGVVIGGGEHPINWISTSPVFYAGRDSINTKFSEFDRPTPKRTIIGNDVWIGTRCIIKQGVKIGHGAIIGAGAVVTKDVEPYSIVAGVPAKHLRYRFSDDVISDLLDSKWWDLNDAKLSDLGRYSKCPKTFLKNLNDMS